MILRTEGVTKCFGGLTAVNNVSLEVNKGEIIGIIGPNGAGKTTFLNCISGFYAPTKGKIYFNDEDITGMTSYDLCRKGISRTFQIVRSFPKMTALDNVKTAIIYGGGEKVKDPDQKAHELLDEVGFAVSHDTIAETLNTMQLKRLMLARAIATKCELLLLDEVAAGLTTAELPDFISLVKQIRDSGVTIICIEHVMKFITDTCDRVIVINFGEKIAEGTAKEVLNNPLVIESYLGKEDEVPC
ncbi:amino acid/amide ABC transporter ATP-binding protein 1, HAAT family [Oscillibacter sp. PC13]|uniref:ABC transporter ATP-binding protein n=1 Tax=Oscillibacter sp. PC13 TaxID=1855299 RepID=UPI0008EF0669|nr:ABC transporter ATP-binding protein [Oscillibacter sp. PC13]SFQ21224.1 amino acid/amide ABC transporter ATP-binding protein 1, HAAT family [Oscillibacter sp. PC13]